MARSIWNLKGVIKSHISAFATKFVNMVLLFTQKIYLVIINIQLWKNIITKGD